MSRSFKKLPICGYHSGSDGKDKQQASQTYRSAVRSMRPDAEVYPLLREISNIYKFKKDGKQYRKDGYGRGK